MRPLNFLAPTTAPGRTVAGGNVVAHLPFTTNRFLGSPSIVGLPGGGWVASHDIFGTDSPSNETYIYRSANAIDWDQVTVLQDMFWGGLFVHRDDLYIIGCTTEYGHLIIRRSTDRGTSWTTPTDSRSGLLRSDGGFHTAPVPVVEHQGRLWRAYEQRLVGGHEWGHFAAVVMSARVEADLLDADNWVSNPALDVPPHLKQAGVSTWLEGNAVPDPSGRIVNVLRADKWDAGHQQAALVPGAEATSSSATPATLTAMPGGGSKFTIRRDQDGIYWTVANTALFDASPDRGLAARNTLSVVRSTDLYHWDVLSVVAHHFDDLLHGFQYCDWQFDGDDLVVLCRTAHDFDGMDAHSYHDSNLITCYRIAAYRELAR